MVSPHDSIELINLFLEYYNKNNNDKGSFIDNINLKDITSTNYKMELFYEYMNEYKILSKNQKDIDIYDENSYIDNDEKDDIYCLIVGKKLNYFSKSFISLLYIMLNYKKKSKEVEWNIIKT
tara:strand:- start:1712 stop:2077 length:366 start_codon:yes stop_codon:yes gene_type:complete